MAELFAMAELIGMAEEEVAAATVRKTEELECEIYELASEKSEEKKEIKKLKEMEDELARCSEEGKAAITARAVELERLHHFSISEMSAADEARMDVAELRNVVEERETRVEFLEREVKGMEQVNAEGEMKVRDMERKVGVLEAKEIEERSKRVRVEEELKDKVDDKKREIEGFREKIEELEKKIVVAMISEMEKWMKEKMELEKSPRESEEKARSMGLVIDRLREEAGEPEKVTRTMKKKVVAAVIGAVNGIHGEVKGVELQWPIVAAGSAAAAIASIIYLCFGKQG